VRVAALLAVAFILSGCAIGGTKTTTVTVTRTVSSPAGGPKPSQAETSNVKYFGSPVYVSKLDAKRYAIAIKPEFFLVGVTANVAFAAQQQNACQPLECPGVEDDRLVIPAGKQNLLFILPAKATGSVLTLGNGQVRTTTVTGAQLAALVGGSTTPKLFESLESGLWLTVNADTVTSFAQQYQP
jgi:hypothetical protein